LVQRRRRAALRAPVFGSVWAAAWCDRVVFGSGH
jgi:hypothetical protein